MKSASFWLRRSSFKYAFAGIRSFFSKERHAKIHALAALMAVVCGWLFGISMVEWLILILVIALVMGLEMANTAIELLADAVAPGYNSKVKSVKDMAAGAVLVAACSAFIIGSIIFIPKIVALF